MQYLFQTERLLNESEESYIWRIGQAKDNGLLDLSWNEISDLINKNFRDSETEYRTESAYRKSYNNAKKFYDSGVFASNNSDNLNDLVTQKQELEKEKVKLRDERNDYKRLLREQARKENFIDQICRTISDHTTLPLSYNSSRDFKTGVKSDNDLIISLTDIHAGIEIDNFFNKFNENVLKKRLNHYLDRIFEVQYRHKSEDAYVILSELISGLIHNTLRIESNQNVIEQFLMITDYLSEFLSELSYHFRNVNIYICPGNHSRLFQDKKENSKGENLDHLALPFLEAKLQNFKNIQFHKNTIEESIAVFSVRGQKVFASHGDKDDPATVVQKYSLMFMKPDLVYLGHRHLNGMRTVYDCKVIESGALSGTDNYCLDKRLKNKPEQTISVITENGLDCLYDVKF